MRGVPVIAANLRDAPRLLRLLVNANLRALARGRLRHDADAHISLHIGYGNEETNSSDRVEIKCRGRPYVSWQLADTGQPIHLARRNCEWPMFDIPDGIDQSSGRFRPSAAEQHPKNGSL
jgi:hypothetical protein